VYWILGITARFVCVFGRMQETAGRKAYRLGRRDQHFGSRHTGAAGMEGRRNDTR